MSLNNFHKINHKIIQRKLSIVNNTPLNVVKLIKKSIFITFPLGSCENYFGALWLHLHLCSVQHISFVFMPSLCSAVNPSHATRSCNFNKQTVYIPFTSTGVGSLLMALTFHALIPCRWGWQQVSDTWWTPTPGFSLVFLAWMCHGSGFHHHSLTFSMCHLHLEPKWHLQLHTCSVR